MKLIIGFLILLISLASHSEVLFFVEYDISLGTVKSMVEALKHAKERPPDALAFVAIIRIVDEQSKLTPFTLVCPPFFPDKDLNGCDMRMVAQKGEPGELSIRIKKNLVITSLEETFQKFEKLLQTDPNSVENWDHKHLGNPFNTSSDVELFCNTEGTSPTKFWSCHLSVTDSSI